MQASLASHPHVFTPIRSTACQGFAKKTKEQCKNPRESGGYCNWHTKQAGKCHAITRGGWRCNLKLDHNDGRGSFCVKWHGDWATPDEAVCQGFKRKDDGSVEPCCRRTLIDDYQYCMPQHDPRVEYTDPCDLRLKRCLLEVEDRRGGNDRYNPGRNLQAGDHADHISELQITSSVLSFVPFDDPEAKAVVVDFALNDVLNKSFNLCLTKPITNTQKGTSTTNFLREAIVHSVRHFDGADVRALEEIRYARTETRAPIVQSFDARLHESGLGRDSTRAITREMKRALKTVVRKFADQGETPVFNDVAHVTLVMAQAMGLLTDLGARLD